MVALDGNKGSPHSDPPYFQFSEVRGSPDAATSRYALSTGRPLGSQLIADRVQALSLLLAVDARRTCGLQAGV